MDKSASGAIKANWLTLWGYEIGTPESDIAWNHKCDMDARLARNDPMTSALVINDIQPWEAYESPATGKMITSKAQRREDMKVSGCRDWEGRESEQKQANRNRDYEEAASDKKLDATVRTAFAQLSPEKKRQMLRYG